MIRPLGQGGMGAVYLVRDILQGEREVALKILRPDAIDPQAVQRFRDEFWSMTRLRHPNLVEVYDFGTLEDDGGQPFLTMEYVDGRDLSTLRWAEVRDRLDDLVTQCLRALDYIHWRGLLHNDIKPQNILARAPFELKLVDFGLAQEQSDPGRPELSGTVHFTAPERFQGTPPDARSDLYSLGIVLYQLLAGRLPFQGDDPGQVVGAILHDIPAPPSSLNPAVPARFDEFVVTLIARDPGLRPRSAAAALDLLSASSPQPLSLDTPETRASFVTSGRLVGRDAELETLTTLAEEHATASGRVEDRPRLVIISGTSGVGKTRLLRELRHRLQLGGIRNVTGRCYETGGVPLQPFVEILRQLPRDPEMSSAPRTALEQLMRTPAIDERDEEADAQGPARLEKAEFLSHLLSALDHLAETRRGIMFLEDLHWCDSPGVDLLEHLLLRPGSGPWLVIATARDDEAETAPIANLMRREKALPNLLPIALASLNTDQVTDLLGSMVPFSERPTGLADLVVERTGGNPLFIEELMKSLADEGALRRHGEAWITDVDSLDALHLPSSLGGMIAKRLAGLGGSERRALEILSVFARPVRQALLAEALHIQLDETAVLLEALERLRLVRMEIDAEGGPLIDLAHGRIGEAILASLSDDERRAHHLSVGRTIETENRENLDECAEELAHHFAAAADRERAVEYCIRAARKAEALFNPRRRVEFLAQALDLLQAEDSPRRIRVLVDLSFACSSDLGDREATLRYSDLLQEEARRAGHVIGEAMALRCRAWALSFQEDDAGAIETARRALALARAIDDRNEIAGCLNYLGMFHARAGNRREALPCFDEAVSLYTALDNPKMVIIAMNNAALCRLGLGELDAAYEILEEVLSLIQSQGLTETYYRYLTNVAHVKADLGDLRGAIRALRESVDWSREHAILDMLGHQLVTLGLFQTLAGEFDHALESLNEARRIRQESGDPATQLIILDYIGNCQRDLGRADLAEEIHLEGLDLARRLGVHTQEGYLLTSLAADAFALGAGSRARESALLAISIAKELDHPRISHAANSVLALVSAAGSDRRAMATLAKRITRMDTRALRFQDLLERNLILGRLALACREPARAEREARAGLALAREGGFREYHWRFLALLGEALEQEGLPDEAADVYNEAHTIIREISSGLEDPKMRHDHDNAPARREVERKATGPGGSSHTGPVRSTAAASERMLASIYEITQVINSILEPEELLDKVMDLAIESVSAERGLIFLYRNATGAMEMVVARNLEHQTIQDATEYSRSILREAGQGRSILSHDAIADTRFKGYRSVGMYQIRSLMCVPLTLKSRLIGTVYVDTRRPGVVFTQDDLRFMEAFANQAAIAIENARLFEEVRQENRYLKQAVHERYGFESIIGRSAEMRQVFALLIRVAGSNFPILIRGESGTGKELVARAIHHNSARRERRFFTENCAALPDTLLESELFGHTKGAFTGADSERRGLFELADGGTLFLDEVGDMSMAMQSKLLRVLQDGEIRPLGSEASRKVDVRVVSATNRNLEEMIKEKKFREDLYFRLNVVTVPLPPLRGRVDDIPLLIDHFLSKVARENKAPKLRVEPSLMAVLSRYEWPGNVRELENQVYRLALFAERDTITLRDAEADLEFATKIATPGTRGVDVGVSREVLLRALEETKGDREKAAALLGISRSTLFRRLRKYGIEPKHPGKSRREASPTTSD